MWLYHSLFIHLSIKWGFLLFHILNNNTCFSVTQLGLTLCDPMNYSMPGFPVLHNSCSNMCSVVLICTSLKTSDIEHFFTCFFLLSVCFFFNELPVHIHCPFLIRMLCFLTDIFRYYILFLSQMYVLNIFLQSDLSFHSLNCIILPFTEHTFFKKF